MMLRLFELLAPKCCPLSAVGLAQARRFFCRILYPLACVALLTVFLHWGLGQSCSPLSGLSAYGESKRSQSATLRELQSQKRRLETERARIRRKKQEQLQKVRMMDTTIYRNQQKLSEARMKLEYTSYTLKDTQRGLSLLEREMDRLVGETTRMQRDTASRLRHIYMGERLRLIQMLLDADNLASLLDRIYYKQKMVAQDKKLLARLQSKNRLLTEKKNELHQQQMKLERTIEAIDDYQSQITQRIQVDRQLRDKYKRDADYYVRAERELLRESSDITAEIRRMTRRASPNVSGSTGMFSWPLNGRITSNFGYRTHPIHRRRLMHTGLDISAPRGTPIRAADGGQVIYAGWRGGYGRVVIINHGNKRGRNMTTLYGHMNGFAVGSGQNVSKGQVVGYVGSTGYATGPHLHFEVRVDGRPTNPLSHL
ncbi:MAG: peptidoglycan DD-metalloendopeptidase family protein [Candidatus Melainabacteria bacterium]|nr:peptidoglycan DD-metalloendopeptidase family protein [Candidatus Melainabacteria bacterium]